LKKKNIINEFFEDESVDLSTDNEIYINLDNVQKNEVPEEPKWTTSVYVPESAKEVLAGIDYKLVQKRMKTINKGDKWYYGIKLLDFLLDHMNFSDMSPNENVYDYITRILEKKLED
jgi:hypothetical protein